MRKKRRARGHHRMTSNVFNMFTQPQIQEFKEAFKMIDQGNLNFFIILKKVAKVSLIGKKRRKQGKVGKSRKLKKLNS